MWAEKHVNKSATSRTKPKSTGRKNLSGPGDGTEEGSGHFGKFGSVYRERKRERRCGTVQEYIHVKSVGAIIAEMRKAKRKAQKLSRRKNR